METQVFVAVNLKLSAILHFKMQSQKSDLWNPLKTSHMLNQNKGTLSKCKRFSDLRYKIRL